MWRKIFVEMQIFMIGLNWMKQRKCIRNLGLRWKKVFLQICKNCCGFCKSEKGIGASYPLVPGVNLVPVDIHQGFAPWPLLYIRQASRNLLKQYMVLNLHMRIAYKVAPLLPFLQAAFAMLQIQE